jgi:CheY-like chemotaxis protein
MARVLIVDDDPWTQRMVSAVLAHSGHAVDIASDGWEALIRAGRVRPDLVVVELRLPTTDGASFMETLRRRPETAQVPALFLATFTTDRPSGASLRPDLDDWLEKPFRLEQLEEKVEVLLERAGVAPRPTGPAPLPGRARFGGSMGNRITPPYGLPLTAVGEGRAAARGGSGRIAGEGLGPLVAGQGDAESPRRAALVGQLDQFGLPGVLVVLELERKSGVVILSRSDARGRLWVREGRVVRAEVDGGADATPPRTRAEAVYELLTWSEGRFEFNAAAVDGEDEIGTSTSFLLMEGARLQDERKPAGGGEPDTTQN